MLLRRRSHDDVRASTSELCERAAAGSARARRHRGHERVVAAADVDGVGRAGRRAVPPRRGAEPDAADLPLPRGVVHRQADQLQAADHAVDVEQVRLPGAGRAGRGRERRHAHARRRSLEPRRRPGDAAARRPRCSTIPRTIRCAGSSTRRARPPTRRARSTPTASVLAGAIGYAEKTHVVADDIALVAFPFTHIGGIIIGVYTPLLTGSAAVLMEAWTARGVDRAHRPAQRDARERRGRDPHRADRRGARQPGRVRDGARLPERWFDQAAAPARRVEEGHPELDRHDVGLRHDRGADRRPDRHRRARQLEGDWPKARRPAASR